LLRPGTTLFEAPNLGELVLPTIMSSSSPSYPRPDFQRPNLTWESLNGAWDFYFDDEDAGLSESWHLASPPSSLRQTIQVPYAFQTPASGINERAAHEVLWYSRKIKDIRTPEARKRGDRLLLRFGAVDYECQAWVGGIPVGSHRGGHVPFDLDISAALLAAGGGGGGGGDEVEGGETTLTLRVRDSPYDLTQPRGKQYWGPVPESIFYTPSSGIWQNVWLEAVPAMRVANSSEGTVLRADDIGSGLLHARVAVVGRRARAPASVEIAASFLGCEVGEAKADLPRDRDLASLDLSLRLPAGQFERVAGTLAGDRSVWREGLALWSPEHPLLYNLTIRLRDAASGVVVDEVQTTTGMRSIDWRRGDGTFRLNDRPVFQSLCLDQGYWPDTLMTPPSADALREDIKLAKKMGFNGCRKHQKVEDPLFLYWADRLGYLVWGEMANAYEFSDEYMSRFNQEWAESVRRDINHPSVVAWTPVNESWAYPNLTANSQAAVDQRNHIRQLYYLTKTLDPTRPVNDNCGWEHVLTDLSTFHEYADGPDVERICSTLPSILHRLTGEPVGRPMFVPPVYGPHASVLDPATLHVSGAPVLNTEFGGVNIAPADEGAKGRGKKFSTEDWGYTTATDPEDLLKRIEKLAVGVVHAGHCSGFVYTQL
jgi:beta-galactosidase/beta-glucuronidase